MTRSAEQMAVRPDTFSARGALGSLIRWAKKLTELPPFPDNKSYQEELMDQFTNKVGYKLAEEINAFNALGILEFEWKTKSLLTERLSVHLLTTCWPTKTWDDWYDDATSDWDAFHTTRLVEYAHEQRKVESGFLLQDTTETRLYKRALDYTAKSIIAVLLNNLDTDQKKHLKKNILHVFDSETSKETEIKLYTPTTKSAEQLRQVFSHWKEELTQKRI